MFEHLFTATEAESSWYILQATSARDLLSCSSSETILMHDAVVESTAISERTMWRHRSIAMKAVGIL